MKKLQLSLTRQEAQLLELKGAQLGYDLTKYVKFILAREAASVMEAAHPSQPQKFDQDDKIE
ncbi:TPA: hypothetical protein DEB02_00950 [Candidatus Beckwithbacteria bacterium]|nr:hypothetical protein [Candidatus Beckwithbacteria bacterium]